MEIEKYSFYLRVMFLSKTGESLDYDYEDNNSVSIGKSGLWLIYRGHTGTGNEKRDDCIWR